MDYNKSQSPFPQGYTNPSPAPPPYFQYPQSGSGHTTPQQGFGFSIPWAGFNQEPHAMGPAQPGPFTVQPSPYAPQFPQGPQGHQHPQFSQGLQGPQFSQDRQHPQGLQGPQFSQGTQGYSVNDYLGYSIFTMLCCCLPIGIGALVNSISARDANNKADWEAARQRSKTALTLNHVALGLGITIMASTIIFVIVAFTA